MKISISDQLRPFSHIPGTYCLIPGTSWALKAYPSKLAFINLELSNTCDVDLNIIGPIKNFTCIQDLEKGKVYVFGMEKRGYFRFEVLASEEGLELRLDRCFKEGIATTVNDSLKKHFYCKDTLKLKVGLSHIGCFSKDIERLSLGNNKKQDWDLITRRADIREIFPIWLKLGIFLPEKKPPEDHPLICELEDKLKNRDKLSISETFLSLFFSNFKGIMCPMRNSQNHLGLSHEKIFQFSPFILLQQGAKFIQKLFFQQDKEFMHILPCLPSSLDCGRYINIQCDEIGMLDMEWSKKKIKKIKLHARADKKICFKLQAKIVSFRVRSSLNDRGRCYSRDEPISLCAGKVYFFDRFRQ